MPPCQNDKIAGDGDPSAGRQSEQLATAESRRARLHPAQGRLDRLIPRTPVDHDQVDSSRRLEADALQAVEDVVPRLVEADRDRDARRARCPGAPGEDLVIGPGAGRDDIERHGLHRLLSVSGPGDGCDRPSVASRGFAGLSAHGPAIIRPSQASPALRGIKRVHFPSEQAWP